MPRRPANREVQTWQVVVWGRPGGNSYHYHETGAFSFRALIDLGEGDDWYSRGWPNNASISTGKPNEADPPGSSLHGLLLIASKLRPGLPIKG